MKTPALPRLFHGRFGQFLTDLLGDDLRAMFALLALGILATLLFCALTAAVELHLKATHAGGKVGIADNGFAFFNYVLGLFSLLIYTVIVCGGIEI